VGKGPTEREFSLSIDVEILAGALCLQGNENVNKASAPALIWWLLFTGVYRYLKALRYPYPNVYLRRQSSTQISAHYWTWHSQSCTLAYSRSNLDADSEVDANIYMKRRNIRRVLRVKPRLVHYVIITVSCDMQ